MSLRGASDEATSNYEEIASGKEQKRPRNDIMGVYESNPCHCLA
jgi:hypothetical protein